MILMGVYLLVLKKAKVRARLEAPLVGCGGLALGIFITRPLAVPQGF